MLNWHPDALKDIGRLYDFLASSNPTAAMRAAATILEASNQVKENPNMGKRHAEFREWPAKFGRGAYILRYLVLENGDLLIVRVWHSREWRPFMEAPL